jgi:hypothetical protein
MKLGVSNTDILANDVKLSAKCCIKVVTERELSSVRKLSGDNILYYDC